MRFLPVFFDTAAGVIALVGSGEPALGKLRLLRAAGAHVRWFSCDADVGEEVLTLPGEGQLDISLGDPLEADLSDVVVIVSAAGNATRHPQSRSAPAGNAFRSTSSTGRNFRPSSFPPSSTVARWWSRSAPAAASPLLAQPPA